jgi:hypothetical protein
MLLPWRFLPGYPVQSAGQQTTRRNTMTSQSNIFAKFLIVTMLTIGCSLPAHAQSAKKPGGGKIGGGIALIISSSVIGGLMILGWGMGACSGEDTNYDKCTGNLLLGGAATLGLGLGIGIPLVVSGARERKAWKKSMAENEPDFSIREGWSLGMTIVDRKPALGFELGI